MKHISVDGGGYYLTPIDYTPNPEQLFYRNGSVVHAIRKEQEYWTINSNQVARAVYDDDTHDHKNRRAQNMFLTEDACKNAKEVNDMHYLLARVVIQINHEAEWTADYEDDDQLKYTLSWNHSDRCRAFNSVIYREGADEVMSFEAKNYMMSDEITDGDFKKFLKIYD